MFLGLAFSQQSLGLDDTISNEATALAIGPKSNDLFIGAMDGTVRVVDLKSLTLKAALQVPGTYMPVDDPHYVGSNRILSLRLSSDETQLAASRTGRNSGGFCTELFGLQDHSGVAFPSNPAVPDFANGSLYFEASPTAHSLWDVSERGSDGSTRSLVKRDNNYRNLWFTDGGFVCWDFDHLRLFQTDSTQGKDLPMPASAEGWINSPNEICFDRSGQHAMVDQHGNLFYAANLQDTPQGLGKVDRSPQLLNANCFFEVRMQLVGNELISVGHVDHFNGKWTEAENGDCSIWDLKARRRTFAFKLKGPSRCSAMAASESVVAVSYSADKKAPAQVDLFSLKDGKLLATLTSPYCEDPRRVEISVKRY